MNLKAGLVTMAGAATLLAVAGCGSSTTGTGDTTPSTNPPATSSAPMSSPHSSGATGPAPTGPSSTPSTQPVVITITDFAYQGPKTVRPGATVTVKNQDATAHTVTADNDGGFDVKVDPGTSATFTAPSKAGSYAYHCTFHANMHGTLTVTP